MNEPYLSHAAASAPLEAFHEEKTAADRDRDEEIGRRIKELRKKYLEIRNQLDFGSSIGVSRGAVANWEIGKGISRVHLLRIADVYSISLSWLSTGRGTPHDQPDEDVNALIQQSGLSERDRKNFIEEVKALLEIRKKNSKRNGNNG